MIFIKFVNTPSHAKENTYVTKAKHHTKMASELTQMKRNI